MDVNQMYLRGTGDQLERIIIPAVKQLPSDLFRFAKGRDIPQSVNGLESKYLEAYFWENSVRVCPREGIECDQVLIPDRAKEGRMLSDRSIAFQIDDFCYRLYFTHQ